MVIPEGPKLSLKVFIDKKTSKVLVAEANSDVVDVLFSFLTLPLGKIVRILEKHYGSDEAPVFGSLTTLYRGVSNLGSSHFFVAGAKQQLNPTEVDISDSRPKKVYFCEDSKCRNFKPNNIAKCVCGKPLNREIGMKEDAEDANVGVFMIKSWSFIICEGLAISPIPVEFDKVLDIFGIGTHLMSIDIDIVDLLKYSLTSATPLADLVNKKTDQKCSTAAKPEPVGVLHHIQDEDANSRKMMLKVLLQNSTNKVLLAVATDEFVEFLFSFLTIPLGGVEYLLGGNTCLNNVDNFYSSATSLKHFMYPNARDYISKFLTLSVEIPPEENKRSIFKQTLYMVRDDLTATPFSLTSSISIPSSLGIALSDVTEKDFLIGHEEALRILNTSLSSMTV